MQNITLDFVLHTILLFFVYGFLGWITEVIYAALCDGVFVNRGFLKGPICPIYGFGVVSCAYLLNGILNKSTFAVFICSMVLTTAIELVTGFALEKLFHTKWWDYSNQKFNFKGYICLKFALLWGLAATFVLKLLHPVIKNAVTAIPTKIQIVLSSVLLIVIIVDFVSTVIAIINLQKRLVVITKLGNELHEFSDFLGENISDAAIQLKTESDEAQKKYGEYAQLVKTHLAEEKELFSRHRAEEKEFLRGKNEKDCEKLSVFKRKLSERKLSQNRILQAFPTMVVKGHQKALDALRKAQKKEPDDCK